MRIHVITLGSPRVLRSGEEVIALPGRPIRFGLLVFLAMEREATRDRLIGLFWGDREEERARHALSQNLYELKQDLGDEWMEPAGDSVRVTEGCTVDALEFQRAVLEGRFTDALSHWGGPFLESVYLASTRPFQEWTDYQRARLGRLHRDARDGFVTERCQTGDLESALQAASEWAARDPLSDRAHHHLITVLARLGRRAEALEVYGDYEALIKEELRLDPLEETRDLVERIRDGSLAGAAEGDPKAHRPAVTWPGSAPWPSVSESHRDLRVRRSGELESQLTEELCPALEILRPIGKGSMATVYLAREPHLRRLVAVKVLSPDVAVDDRARMRFEREAQTAARLEHPNICTVHWVGTLSDGLPFLVMGFVKGSSLAERLRAEGRFLPVEVRRVMGSLAAALAAAHQEGFIHRDVRPDNVLQEEGTGRLVLCDFGIAGVLETGEEPPFRLTATGEILGSPAYISPEQMAGEPLTDRTDIYSLGVLAYELLTGRPAPGDSVARERALDALVESSGAPAGRAARRDRELVDLVRRCLSDVPNHRPSASDLARKLRWEERREAGGEGGSHETERGLLPALRERRFLQILGPAIAGGWATIEAVGHFVDRGMLPRLADLLVPVSVLHVLAAISILAWFHGKKGRQTMPPAEKWLLGAVAMTWVVATALVFWSG